MAISLPFPLPAWRPAWLLNLRAALPGAAPDDRTRLQPPRMRLAAALSLSFLLAVLTVLLTALFCLGALRTDLAQRLATNDAIMLRLAQEIQDDLVRLDQGLHERDCDLASRESLTLQAFTSTLVREFMYRGRGQDRLCSSFGLSQPEWMAALAPAQGLQILATQSLTASIIVAMPSSVGEHVAVIPPRQMLDRLPDSPGSHTLRLMTTDGRVLASIGQGAGAEGGLMPDVALRRPIEGWPLQLEMSFGQSALVEAVRAQWLLMVLIWSLGSVLLVGLFNQYWRRQSSRALRLQHALRKRRFAPVMQPIVDARSGACIGVEVLMRWKHPQRGLIAPAEFIGYAERSGLIVPMSDLLMRQACHQAAEIALAHPHLYFSFNVTPGQLLSPGFADSLLQIFDGDPIGPSRVLLELTERDLVDEQIRAELTRLRSKGFRIAIDDFGTGHSSLALLQDLSLDRLKIDRAFVNTISADAAAQPVLDAIIALSHRLGLIMIAEGIETQQQADYLRARGVQTFQGYLFARPLTPPDLSAWLQAADGGRANAVAPDFPQASWNVESLMQALEQARPRLERSRWHRLRHYRDCMLGNELVGWIARHYGCSREQALRMGQRLVSRGLLEHVLEEHDLEDAPYFYRLIPLASVAEALRSTMLDWGRLKQWSAWLQGPLGARPGVRCKGLLRHEEVLSGRELVEALGRAAGMTREAALDAGVQMMRAGLISHVFDDRGFSDHPGQFYLVSFGR